MAYALRYQDRLDRLVLNDTVHSREGWQQNIDNANHVCRNQYPEIWEKLIDLRKQGVTSSDPNYGQLYGKAMGDVYWFDLKAKEALFRSGDPLLARDETMGGKKEEGIGQPRACEGEVLIDLDRLLERLARLVQRILEALFEEVSPFKVEPISFRVS